MNQRTYYEFERRELGQLLNTFQLVFATQNSRGKEEGRKVHDSDVYLKIELIDGTFEEYYWGLHQMFFTPGWKELVDAIHDLMLQGSTFLGHIFTSLPHNHLHGRKDYLPHNNSAAWSLQFQPKHRYIG